MKLSWRDVATTLLAVFGGAIAYAKFYDYSWATIGSWRGATAVMALTGLIMFAVSGFDFSNRSILNEGEMFLGVVAIGLAVAGVIITSQPLFYTLAGTLGVLWLVDTARHVRHSLMHDESSAYGHHAQLR